MSHRVALTRRIFERAVSPAYFMGYTSILWSGIAGRSFQISFNGSKLVRTVMPPWRRSSWIRFSTELTLLHIPSTPTCALVSLSLSASHRAIVGVPFTFRRISWNEVPSSCFSAARKYLLSVQRAAESIVTTAVPAEPSNPLIHSLPFHLSGVYSEWCGSVDGKTKASSFSRRITSRRLARRLSTVSFIMVVIILLIW